MVAISQTQITGIKLKKLVIVTALVLAGFLLLKAGSAQAAACAAPSTDYGTVTSSVNITSTGSYRIWSRIASGTASTDNSYLLEIDGNTCYTVGDNNSMPTGSWQWVDYQNGSTSSKIDINLTVGVHTIKMIGREDGVKLDRVVLTTDTGCVPTGTGDNCANPADTTNPTASLTSPAANSKLRGTVTVNATASDDSGVVSKVEFYVDGTMVGAADTTAPYSFSWNTTTASNGTHSLTVRAYDPSNNVVTSSAVSVVVDNSAPTVSLTAPANGATLSGTSTLTATASDNTAVTAVEFYRGTTLLNSDTSSPYSYAWDTTGVTNGSYSITAKAYDEAGNSTTSTAASVTVNNTVTPPPDTTLPTTSITAPANGATVSATTTINASAGDNVGVTRVELYIDGVLAAPADVASPYSFSWNTTTYSNGSHTIQTRAYDAAGNQGVSPTITVTVSNASSNPGDVTGDGHVTIIDLSILLSNYGKSGQTRSTGDLDGNGIVSIADLSRLLSNYGT